MDDTGLLAEMRAYADELDATCSQAKTIGDADGHRVCLAQWGAAFGLLKVAERTVLPALREADRLRARVAELERAAQLQHVCVVCECLLQVDTREESAPHCEDCSFDYEDSEQYARMQRWRDTLLEVAAR